MVVFDADKEGSDQYTWDKAGERVKHERFHCITENGWTKKQFVKIVYKAL
jgi:hypothetical protein